MRVGGAGEIGFDCLNRIGDPVPVLLSAIGLAPSPVSCWRPSGRYPTRFTPGGFQVRLPSGRIEGGLVFGQ